MRTLLAGIVAACALVGASAEAMQWDGLYGGLQARYAWTKTDIDIPTYHQPPFAIDTEGASYGAFIGARWRLNPRWSAGVEIEATWYDESERSPTGHEGELYILEHNWAASARAFAAYDVAPETRIYAAAGIAFTEAAAAYAPSTRRADEEPLRGWTIALGLEHDYSDRLFSRAELRYTAYEDGEFGHLTPSITESEETAVMIGLAWRFRN